MALHFHLYCSTVNPYSRYGEAANRAKLRMIHHA